LKSQLVPLAADYSEFILGEYKTARLHLESTIDKEAQVQLAMLSSDRDALRVSITTYNDAVRVIDECLQSVGCDRFQLPLVEGFEESDS
jgi:hypothetical protein